MRKEQPNEDYLRTHVRRVDISASVVSYTTTTTITITITNDDGDGDDDCFIIIDFESILWK